MSAMVKKNTAYLPADNLLIDLDGLIGKEWRIACCHFIDEHTSSPPVHCLVIALLVSRQIKTNKISQNASPD